VFRKKKKRDKGKRGNTVENARAKADRRQGRPCGRGRKKKLCPTTSLGKKTVIKRKRRGAGELGKRMVAISSPRGRKKRRRSENREGGATGSARSRGTQKVKRGGKTSEGEKRADCSCSNTRTDGAGLPKRERLDAREKEGKK